MAAPDFSLRHLWLVLAREYRVRVRSRSFVVSTIATPLLFAFFIFLPVIVDTMFGARAGLRRRAHEPVVIVCSDRKLADLVRAQLAQDPDYNHPIAIDPDSSARERELLDRQLRSSAIAAYIWLGGDAIASGRADYYTRGRRQYNLHFYLRHSLAMALARARLLEGGMAGEDIDRMLRPVDLRFVSVVPESPPRDVLVAGLGVYVLAYLLLFSIVLYGGIVMQSVTEEKLSRINELLLVSTRPEELMTGKIAGVGAVGLTQMAIWFVLGGALALLLPSARTLLKSASIGIGLAISVVVFFVLGYLLYSALYAVAGAATDGTTRWAQGSALIMLPMFSSLMLLPMIAEWPDSTPAVIASMIPYLAPITMYARIALGSPPGWQIALSIAVMIATIGGSAIVCARIYRVGMLMYGKRLTLREVGRWLRYA